MSPKMYSCLIGESLKTMTLTKNTQAVESLMQELDYDLIGIKTMLYGDVDQPALSR